MCDAVDADHQTEYDNLADPFDNEEEYVGVDDESIMMLPHLLLSQPRRNQKCDTQEEGDTRENDDTREEATQVKKATPRKRATQVKTQAKYKGKKRSPAKKKSSAKNGKKKKPEVVAPSTSDAVLKPILLSQAKPYVLA
jgi:hypothetical protein